MKVFAVMVIPVLATASALAYAPVTLADGAMTRVMHVAGGAGEPAALLLSGSCLLGLAGALRRFTV